MSGGLTRRHFLVTSSLAVLGASAAQAGVLRIARFRNPWEIQLDLERACGANDSHYDAMRQLIEGSLSVLANPGGRRGATAFLQDANRYVLDRLRPVKRGESNPLLLYETLDRRSADCKRAYCVDAIARDRGLDVVPALAGPGHVILAHDTGRGIAFFETNDGTIHDDEHYKRLNGLHAETVGRFYLTPLTETQRKAVTFADMAGYRLHHGNPEGAVGDTERALDMWPDYPVASNNLAVAQIRLGKTKAALKAARNATEADPTYLAAQHNLGRIFIERGKREELWEGVDLFTKIVQDPRANSDDRARAYMGRGHTYRQLGFDSRMRDDFRNARRIESSRRRNV